MIHSKLGASSAKRWMTCAGSVTMAEGMPNHSSAAAEEGTAAHELAECTLKGGQEKTRRYVGLIAENGVEFTLEMAEYIQEYVDEIRRVEKECKNGSIHETEFSFEMSSVHELFFGTNDDFIYDMESQVLEVTDLKYGAGLFVEVEDNPQLKYYGLGALLALQSIGYEVKKVRIKIIQPRIPCEEGIIRYQDVTPGELMDFAVDLYNAALATEEENAPLVSGDHCQFCPGAIKCPELIRTANEAMKIEFAEELPYDTDELSKALTMAELLKTWIKSVQNFAWNQANVGVKTPGFKLVAKRASRSWNGDATHMRKMLKKLSKDEIAKCFKEDIKTPAQVEKVLGKEHVKFLSKFILSKSSGTNLVPQDHKSPEVASSAEVDFKELLNQKTGDK